MLPQRQMVLHRRHMLRMRRLPLSVQIRTASYAVILLDASLPVEACGGRLDPVADSAFMRLQHLSRWYRSGGMCSWWSSWAASGLPARFSSYYACVGLPFTKT